VTKAIEHSPSRGTLGDLVSSMALPTKGQRMSTLAVWVRAHVAASSTLCPPYSHTLSSKMMILPTGGGSI
jgi:hypothetical protein